MRKKIIYKILKWLRLIQDIPHAESTAPKGIWKTTCPKQFDEKVVWDKDKFNNINYIE